MHGYPFRNKTDLKTLKPYIEHDKTGKYSQFIENLDVAGRARVYSSLLSDANQLLTAIGSVFWP